MSLSRRLLDLARANLNALLDKASGDTTLDELTDKELEAELERRRDRRKRMEEERQHRIAAEQAARARGPQSSARRPSDARKSEPPPPRPASAERIQELYKLLEVPPGSSLDEVKKSFRRLMRKYHPDVHAGNPTKHKAATELTMTLTQAYEELERHLTRK